MAKGGNAVSKKQEVMPHTEKHKMNETIVFESELRGAK